LSFSCPVPLRLTFRKTLNCAPLPIGITYVPRYAGLYAIMVYDSTCTPLPFRLIYVGKANSLVERVCRQHEHYPSWLKVANGGIVYVSFYAIADEAERGATEERLIEHYAPECNIEFNRARAAAQRLYSEIFNVAPWRALGSGG
jgi:hypothetical protein